MIVILMQIMDKSGFFDFMSEPFGILLFAIVLIGCAVSLRWFFKWNEEMTQRAQKVSSELLEKTVN